MSKTSKAIVCRGAAPFASTLRPNLTGGALPRSAGGYSLGAGRGVRHFSHSPSAQAHVVQNVSAGIRAFVINGGKARFDGINEQTGEKRFMTISKSENGFYQRFKKPFTPTVKGTSLEFPLSPTITALSTAAPAAHSASASTLQFQSINENNLLDNLSIDFARTLRDFSTILSELRRLSTLGDLPLSLTHGPSGPILALRFPGCDGASVSRLCNEANICRGIIREDEAWGHDRDVEMALLFPFAPGNCQASHGMSGERNDYFEHCGPAGTATEQLDWRQMMSSYGPSLKALDENDVVDLHSWELTQSKKFRSTCSGFLSGYESLGADSDFAPEDPYLRCHETARSMRSRAACSDDYEGVEGIYRFLKECEDARL